MSTQLGNFDDLVPALGSQFNFLPQDKMVKNFLDSCVEILDWLPTEKRTQIEEHLRNFERSSVTMTIGLEDIDGENKYDLTEAESRTVLAERIRNASLNEDDIANIEYICGEVAAERVNTAPEAAPEPVPTASRPRPKM